MPLPDVYRFNEETFAKNAGSGTSIVTERQSSFLEFAIASPHEQNGVLSLFLIKYYIFCSWEEEGERGGM